MPTSEPLAGTDWERELEGFLERIGARPGREGVVAAFHGVRRMAYRSGPDRTPQAALRSGRGACTAKHILLRDLLRRLGERAEVEIVQGDFAAGIPVQDGMGEDLVRMLRQSGITDFHCRTVWDAPEGEIRLDATWPDRLTALGFPVNDDWDGEGETRPAIERVEVRARAEDAIAVKEALLAELPPEVAAERKEFLRLLSEWLAGLE